MQAPHPPRTPQQQLARQTRARWLATLQSGLPQLAQAVEDFLKASADQTALPSAMAARRQALQLFGQKRSDWISALERSLAEAARNSDAAALSPARSAASPRPSQFELVGDDVFENKIIASRISIAVAEALAPAMDALRIRLHALGDPGWSEKDVFRPETFSLILVECWLGTGLARGDLDVCIAPLQCATTELLQAGYDRCNLLLAEHGVSAERDLRLHVRSVSPVALRAAPAQGRSGSAHAGPAQGGADLARRPPAAPFAGGFARGPFVPSGRARSLDASGGGGWEAPQLVLARGRARSAITQLHQVLTPLQGGSFLENARPASAALAQALAAHRASAQLEPQVGAPPEGHNAATVAHVASKALEGSAKLKEQAETESEKAIIEVVALMFQSILAEERIAPAVRVWFARLQVPVLRLALAEPEFFNNEDHAARKLIDRMGAVALGFDSATVSSGALEAEVRRIVQVIEQFPETGRRVYQLVYMEFEKFLAKHLTEQVGTAKVISVAQQVEQKETLAIKYTIEFRTLLDEVDVNEEVRDFLFKVWAEVLALSAMRSGVAHEQTMTFNRTAADIVWAASAKPNRSERTQVIQSLPEILQRVRAGLALLGLEGDAQDQQIKSLTDTLAKAFLSKAAPVPLERIEAMVRRLASVEEYLGDAVLGDLPLDADNIELLTGIDAAALQVIADNGVQAQESMVAWAQQLALGNWFTLEHKGSEAQVQYVWHSERKQLHLFVTNGGTSYLVQLNRLAFFLENELLVASDEDGLITRATRDAADKLNANPGRLLG